jgi:GT2 family glycosyltransferase
MTAKRIAVLTIWRDSADTIGQSLAQYEALENDLIPKGYRFIYAFLENDSQDLTASMLHCWLRSRKGFLLSENTDSPKWGSVQSIERTQWLARYRNLCLQVLDYWEFDYLLVADGDVIYRTDLIERMVQHLEEDQEVGMVTPNTVQNVIDVTEDSGLPSYYDSWALRSLENIQGLTFASNPFLNLEDRQEWETGFPVTVGSAFGSIALVRGSILQEFDIAWDGEEGCEHWAFCKGIRSAGYEVIVDPELHAEIKHDPPVVPTAEVIEFQKERLKQHTQRLLGGISLARNELCVTFGICTGYDNPEHLIKCVNSIRKQADYLYDYEILIVGPEVPDSIYNELDLEANNYDIEFIEFDESIKPRWITKKKNLIAQNASFERLCILHDYLWLTPDWAKNLAEFENTEQWSVLAFPQLRTDGGRFWYDWSGFKGPRHLDQRQFYSYKDWSHNDDVYISGNIFCVNRYLLLNHPFDENLAHMQEEDLEWSRRISPYAHFKCAHSSIVCHQKEHRDQAYFLKVDAGF